jgi:hypothetical protein
MQRAFIRADKKLSTELRGRLREAAEPVAGTAETLAESQIRNIGVRWSRMRVGVTRSLVYVAPRQRGVKTNARNRLRRPNLAPLLMDRAMSPALDQHTSEIVESVDRLLVEVGRDWER